MKRKADLPSLCLAITEHAPLPMATVEGATHILRYANPAFCRMLGESIEQLVGKPLSELLPEKDECIRLLDRVFQAKRPESHIEEAHSKPHPVFWAYTMWPVLEDEGLVGVMIQVTETAEAHGKTIGMNQALVLGSIRQHVLTEAAENLNSQLRAEIIERKRMALELSEKARLLDLTTDAIIVRGLEGEIRYWNNGAEGLYGWAREKALGKISHNLLQTEFPTPLVQILEVLYRTGRWTGELVNATRDGRRVTVLARKTLDRDNKGNPVAVLTVMTDITARRALEDSLAARAEDLVRADRSKDEFLAMLGHELRNPLVPLLNSVEILQNTKASAETREQARCIFARQIRNMGRIIDDLLDISRITEGKIELRKQVVGLDAIFSAAASLARPGIEARGQELSIQLPAQPIFLNADPTRLDQIFGNLLNNASKYSDCGCHISFSAERTAAPDKEPPEVMVRVSDDGIGMSPELLPRIFDLFVQSPQSLDRAYGGLGVGLALVQQLVKLHNGSVEAHSRGVGHGSEFIVRLPILAGPAVVTPPPSPVSSAIETPRRILIVDDNEDSARSMSTLQRLRGHETCIAFSGPEALDAAAKFSPEVVLLDIGLPGMDGYEVARRLREMPALAGAFLVAITGYDSAEDRAQGRAAGFDEYMIKPVDNNVLRAWLRSRSNERQGYRT